LEDFFKRLKNYFGSEAGFANGNDDHRERD
jgi:hypothetical protein